MSGTNTPHPLNDPAPWVHTSGARASSPYNTDAPEGGYTYSPREGYADHPDRYISTRHGDIPPKSDEEGECRSE